MASERLQGEQQFYSKKYLLEMPHSHVKNTYSHSQRLEKCTTKTDLFNGKSFIKKLDTRL